MWPLWSWSYGSWIYNYLCNQCLSSLKLCGRTPFMARYIRVITKLPNSVHGKVYSIQLYQWQAIGRLFSLGTPVSSTNTTDRNDITEMLLKVALNTINQTKSNHKYYHNELLNLLLLWKRFNSDSINIKKRTITSLLNKLNTKRPW